MAERRRRVTLSFVIALLIAVGASFSAYKDQRTANTVSPSVPAQSQAEGSDVKNSAAIKALGKLAIKGRAPQTGYSRTQFGGDWATIGACDMREHVLGRDLTSVRYRSASDCTVLSGTLDDPYTGKIIHFVRGPGTSTAVQIDHVVAISDAWQTGAQQLSRQTRVQLYDDPLELLAVDGPANDQKGDGDAATWLPPNKAYRCRYVARQIAVKVKYNLWVTPAEHDAMQQVLGSCPSQPLPVVSTQAN